MILSPIFCRQQLHELGTAERIKELFEAARNRNPAEREALVAEACGGDDALRAEVRSLLSGGQSADSFRAFHGETGITHTITEGDRAPVDFASKSLGGFQLIRLIGRGGMGSVYDPEDPGSRFDFEYNPRQVTFESAVYLSVAMKREKPKSPMTPVAPSR